jgi:hypothetical protein
MARSRNIKPGFFKNEDLVELDFATRLLFAGLWTIADKEGRLEDRPKKIKIDVFPSDNVDVEAMLASLAERRFIHRYSVEGARYVQIVNWDKHQNPHHTEKASVIPPFNGEPVVKDTLDAGESQSQDGGNPADSLIPGFTDSLIPDSPIPGQTANTLFDRPPPEDRPEPTPQPTPAPKPVKPPKAKKEPPKTGEAWAAYATAYRLRYRAEPVRNLMVNSQMAQVVGRLGAEAAMVAAFYLNHKNRFYVEKMHPVGLLLQDAEKLRTEWFTGQQVTQAQAFQADRTQTNFNAFASLLAEAKESHHAES